MGDDELIEREHREVYLAGPWQDRPLVAKWAKALENEGHRITRRWWIDEVPDNDVANLTRCATSDLFGVNQADTFILLNWRKSEGKATELGYALAHGKRIIVVAGEDISNNIFLNLDTIKRVRTLQELISAL